MVLSIRASIFKNSELNILTCHVGYFDSNKSTLKNPVTLSKKEVGSKNALPDHFYNNLS